MINPRCVRWSFRHGFNPGETDLVGEHAGVTESTWLDGDPRFVDPLPAAMARVCRRLEHQLADSEKKSLEILAEWC